uniref:NADH dehydrogenase [ubiquinone] 1 alpha subcomplex assembly factor 2-like n=1 Tax=Jaculus jaculus TaxID=51337 RepID=UPI001E1B2D89|nr:NADH dehydrogenase [ubiquinone] 1 alpha subcomplex assembly factor 2-like [Jaculus jaculus]
MRGAECNGVNVNECLCGLRRKSSASRGLVAGWFRAPWRALLSREARELVGSDHLGNKYCYVPSYKNWRGQTIREKRIVEAANKKEVDYEVGSIPTEWEAWIRKTRKTPPTMEGESERMKKWVHRAFCPHKHTLHACATWCIELYTGSGEPLNPAQQALTTQPLPQLRSVC